MTKACLPAGHEIAYANDLGISTFGKADPFTNALAYFGTEVWAVLFRCISKLSGKEQYVGKANFTFQHQLRSFRVHLFKEMVGEDEVICISLTDETESESERKQLLTTKERYHSIFNNNLDPLITINKAGEILFANPTACKAFGYRKDEWRTLYIVELIGERCQHNLQYFIQRGFDGESIQMDD